MEKIIDEPLPASESAMVAAGEKAKPSDREVIAKNHCSIPGQAYLLTATTVMRRPIFRDFEAARAAASVHAQRWVWRDSRILAWVLMPSQWQCLVVLGQNDELQNLMGRFKMASSKAMDARYKTCGWVWGRGFRVQALDKEAVLRDVGRQLITQPIRAGLAQEVGGYSYWNAVWLNSAIDEPAWPGSRR